MENSLLSVKQAAAYLGLKESNLYAKVERQEIPYYRVGRLIRFKKDQLDEWVEKGRVDCLDAEKEAQKILSTRKKPKSTSDLGSVIKKAIAEETGARYNVDHGKPDRVKGLRKEVCNEYN